MSCCGYYCDLSPCTCCLHALRNCYNEKWLTRHVITQTSIAQAVTNSRFRYDEFRPCGIHFDLLSKLGHVHSNMVHHIGMPMSPDLRQNLAMCQNPSGIACEQH